MNIPQEKINVIKAWQEGTENIVLGAVAGSGKTFTLLQAIKALPGPYIYLSFNKKIQLEVERKVEANVNVMTFHSLGLSLIRKNVRKFTINMNKKNDILFISIDSMKKSFYRLNKKKQNIIRFAVVEMFDIHRIQLIDDYNTLLDIVQSTLDLTGIKQVVKILYKKFISLWMETITGKSIIIDFEDMMFVPRIRNFKSHLPESYLIIDELQDITESQWYFVELLKGKKWLAAGDKYQSIYQFRGASVNLFNRLEEENKAMTLSICYRCPKKVIDEANKVYQIMEYGIDATGSINIIEQLQDIHPTSMVLCRNTNPLLELFFQLNHKQKAYFNGKKTVSSLVSMLKINQHLTPQEALSSMRAELSVMKDSESKGQFILKQNIKMLKLLMEHRHNDTINGYIKFIIGLTKANKGIMLTTIHGAKGLESENVVFLNQNLIPSKFAKTTEELIQEQNLRYVAITRSTKNLFYLNI